MRNNKDSLDGCVNDYEGKYSGFAFDISNPLPNNTDPCFAVADIILKTKDGKRYISNFITRKYLDHMFEKNKTTGECAKGTFFAMPQCVIIEDLTRDSVKKTINDMIDNVEVENYFVEMS